MGFLGKRFGKDKEGGAAQLDLSDDMPDPW
jgi:hypothetical protein